MNSMNRRVWLFGFAMRSFSATDLELPDVPLRTHDGRAMSLRELTAGSVFAVQLIFTSCKTICPVLGVVFSQVQRAMTKQGRGRELLISISVDPQNDSCERLAEFLARYKAQPGWSAVRVEKPHLDRLLEANWRGRKESFSAFATDPRF